MKKTRLSLFILPAMALVLVGAGCSGTVTPEAGAGEANTIEPVEETVVVEEAVQDGTITVDTDASIMTWSGAKKIGATHHGTIALSKGTLTLEAGKLTGGSVTIDMTTIKDLDLTRDSEVAMNAVMLETHLMSEDFFDVAAFPEATFDILAVTYTSDTTADVTGNLTLHGVTNPVTLATTLEQKDGMWLASAEVTLDRTLWNVNFGSGSLFKELGDAIINDEMIIAFNLEAK
ncbi:MAG: hypothetical protein COU33_04785 [Candidatus Magasanikbacteria bacterium CG10_big_fil_rev_8_21_14_0_10_43_6]|uniref:Lipid/polyisoprenoid-binding YceI-like domain-containing protein n=1 Tax=Candidatus Magasanikbacteria bacterium CG10_big_fil_rev_8_21_14_0_10_43_6 TaxID=1974650 RepID=A0A2M6W011_9BACT|nr:MAG: hypothetical protein COU33_04785 [Candidatus Magasanikbacteria bacterium CG10_big_fil_rev_8_21_14_0_10_43_6]